MIKKWTPLLLACTSFFAKEPIHPNQYDPVAHTYAAVVLDQNQDSISRYFDHFNFPLEGKKILDLGCGNGYDLRELRKKGAIIYGIDASKEMVALAKQENPEGQIKVGYFEQIPFPDNFFDAVISKWALQTAPHIDPIYHEIGRVLKPNAQLIYLATHPIRQFIEKKRNEKNYFQKEIVESVFFNGQITAKEPSHTMNEYLSPTFFQYFTLEAYEEGFDSGAEKINLDIYPSYFIIKALRKQN